MRDGLHGPLKHLSRAASPDSLELVSTSTPLSVILICGANGAGKTTFARQLLPMSHRGVEFLNVDEIQHSCRPPLSQVAAAREFLMRLAKAERKLESFALETTLSSITYGRRIERWRRTGYHVVLHFIEVHVCQLCRTTSCSKSCCRRT